MRFPSQGFYLLNNRELQLNTLSWTRKNVQVSLSPEIWPPLAPYHHPAQPEPPIGGNRLALRILKLECALFDVEHRRIALAAGRERAQ
jgi:hypothetical protein